MMTAHPMIVRMAAWQSRREKARAQQSSFLPTPRADESDLPLGELDPEVLERLAAEMIKVPAEPWYSFLWPARPEQSGLDILEREATDANSVCQVRHYEALPADGITSAVTEYADPQPPKADGETLPAASRRTGRCCSPPRSSRRDQQ
jgi:hypothetical protein